MSKPLFFSRCILVNNIFAITGQNFYKILTAPLLNHVSSLVGVGVEVEAILEMLADEFLPSVIALRKGLCFYENSKYFLHCLTLF